MVAEIHRPLRARILFFLIIPCEFIPLKLLYIIYMYVYLYIYIDIYTFIRYITILEEKIRKKHHICIIMYLILNQVQADIRTELGFFSVEANGSA